MFALADGGIAFIDCGQIGQLDDESTNLLADLVSGVVRRDVDGVCTVLAKLTDASFEAAESHTFRADIRGIVLHFEDTSLGQINIGSLLGQFFRTLRSHQLRCPANLVLLIKAVATIESAGKDVEPTFDFVSYGAPYVQRLVERRYGVSALRDRLRASIGDYALLAEDLSRDVHRLLHQLKRNRITVNIEHRGLDRVTAAIEHASRNIGFCLIVAAMLIGSSILVLADRTQGGDGATSRLGRIGLVTACIR